MKRMTKKMVLAIMMAVLSIMLVIPAHAANKMKINKKSATLYVGNTLQLSVKGSAKKAKWTSSNNKVASVSKKGLVKAKKKGNAKITARVGRKKFTCSVKVKAENAKKADNNTTGRPENSGNTRNNRNNNNGNSGNSAANHNANSGNNAANNNRNNGNTGNNSSTRTSNNATPTVVRTGTVTDHNVTYSFRYRSDKILDITITNQSAYDIKLGWTNDFLVNYTTTSQSLNASLDTLGSLSRTGDLNFNVIHAGESKDYFANLSSLNGTLVSVTMANIYPLSTQGLPIFDWSIFGNVTYTVTAPIN